MRRLPFLALALFLLLGALPVRAEGGPNFRVTQTPPRKMRVGDPFVLQVHVPQQPGRWLFTLELMDPVAHDRADFGGWVQSRRWQLVEPAAGDTDVTWNLQAGAPGRFRLFVHATPADDAATAGWISEGFDLAVDPAPPQHTGPMLAVAVGEPLLVGLCWLWQLRRRRRQRA